MFSSVSVRVLALFTLEQGHHGEMSDDQWRAKGSQVTGHVPGLAAAGSKPLQPGPGGEPRGAVAGTWKELAAIERAAWQQLRA